MSVLQGWEYFLNDALTHVAQFAQALAFQSSPFHCIKQLQATVFKMGQNENQHYHGIQRLCANRRPFYR